jgi:hypothetical protein
MNFKQGDTMPLNEEQKEMLRIVILQNLYAARILPGLRLNRLLIGAKVYGFELLEEEDLAKQLRYLAAHGLIEPVDRKISKAVELFRITQAGTAYLDENNLTLD